jgi:hypothetical protein
MAGPVRPELLVLLGAVCLVLFICCGNVAMLLLVRGIGRAREFGLRTALGASRPRIAVQLLTENLLLSLAGGGLGAALAVWLVSLLVQYGPRDIPRLSEVHMDARVLLFALALTILTPLLFGVGPALQLSRPDVNTALQEGGKSSTAGRRRALLRTGFLIAEMALSLLLLAGAGLLVKSFLRLASVEPGFRPDHLLTFQLQLPTSKFLAGGQYLEGQVARYYQEVIDRLGPLPQVESVACAMDLPMVGGGYRLWQGFALPQQISRRPEPDRPEHSVGRNAGSIPDRGSSWRCQTRWARLWSESRSIRSVCTSSEAVSVDRSAHEGGSCTAYCRRTRPAPGDRS